MHRQGYAGELTRRFKMNPIYNLMNFREFLSAGSDLPVAASPGVRSSGRLEPDPDSHRIIPVVVHQRAVAWLLSGPEALRAVLRDNPRVGGAVERPAWGLLERLRDQGQKFPGEMLVVYASNMEVDSLWRMARALRDHGEGEASVKVASHLLASLGEGERWHSRPSGELGA